MLSIPYFRYKKVLLLKVLGVFFIAAAVAYGYYQKIDRVEFYRRYHKEIQFFNKISNIFYFPFSLKKGKLERYDLILSKKDLDFLNANLPKGYEGNLLTDQYKKTVNGKFIYGGKEYNVKVRYRGDTDNHWRDPQKSWLVTFEDENYFENNWRMHLIIPVDREYLLEELNNYRAKKLGLAVPETKFVNLFVNGKRHGAYWMAEPFSKDLLERNDIPGDVNLYGGVDFSERIVGNFGTFDNPHEWRKYSLDSYSPQDNFRDLEALLDIIKNPSDEYFYNNIQKIVDMDNLLRWLMLQELVTSTHQSGFNMKMYFDATDGKFKFIPWDILIGDPPPAYYDQNHNIEFIGRLLQIPEFLHRRNELLWEYAGNEENLKDDLSFYDRLDEDTRTDFLKDTLKVDSHRAYRKRVELIRKKIQESFEYNKENIKFANATITFRAHNTLPLAQIIVSTKGFSSLNIKSISLKLESCRGDIHLYEDGNTSGVLENTDKKIATLGCRDGEYFGKFNSFVYASREPVDEYLLQPAFASKSYILQSADPAYFYNARDESFSLEIENATTGKSIKNPSVRFSFDNLSLDLEALDRSLQEAAKAYPILRVEGGKLRIPRGNYFIAQDVIIPKNTELVIDSGTTFFFGPGASFESRSPITARGERNLPITFRANGSEPWGSVRVIGVNATSTFAHTRFVGGKDDYFNGVFSSGMLSLYHTPFNIEESIFENSQGDDAVNIKYGYGIVKNNTFRNTKFDALDLDVTSSVVDGNIFENIGNDAVDMSSFSPNIMNNRVFGAKDKCLSVGESSSPVIFNNLLTGCNIGIAVKDSSEALIVNNTIIDNNTGISGYKKKQIYNGSRAKVWNSVLWENAKSTEADDESKIEISNSVVEGGFAGENISTSDPKLDNNFIISPKNPLNSLFNESIFETLGPEFLKKKQLGFSL